MSHTRFTLKISPLIACALMTASPLSFSQTAPISNAQSIADGKAFAASMLPTSKTNPVSATANTSVTLPSNAPTATPLYTTVQPGSAGYTSGVPIVSQGSAAITKCQNYVSTGNAVADQECAGVSFLANNPVQTQFVIQQNDPTRAAFKTSIAGAVNHDTPGQQCVMTTVTAPATYKNDQCAQSLKINTLACNKLLVPRCDYFASPINNLSIGTSGSFAGSTSLVTVGTYSFSLTTGFTSLNGSAVVSFNLDSVGHGSYVHINMDSIDDAGVIAINGIPVWAGYPNSGPAYTYGALGSPTTPSFVQGFSWTEASGTYSADTKILDTCPSGHPRAALSGSDTRSYLTGFFCNGNGQFLMNTQEGRDSRSASVSGDFPIKVGANTIEVFWGTNSGGTGGMLVTGSIYNTKFGCLAEWSDGCDRARGAIPPVIDPNSPPPPNATPPCEILWNSGCGVQNPQDPVPDDYFHL